MIATHLFCAAAIYGSQFANIKIFEGVQVVIILAMTT